MKRVNHLLEKITDLNNLYSAFYKASKGKSAQEQVIAYQNNLHANISNLRWQLITGNIEVGNYTYFKIFDPKERIICAAPFSERVLHHAIMNVCHQTFNSFQIYNSYASIKGKGQYAALNKARVYTAKYKWFLKLDIRKFFDSINHNTLSLQLASKFKEKKLLQIFNDIINSYCVLPNQGVPIGNLTSQYFANHYLALCDHYIKEKLKAKAYVRYMDDMVLWHNNKQDLLDLGKKISSYLRATLQLQLKTFCLNRSKYGLPFLGYVLTPNQLRLNTNSKKRFKKKLQELTYKFNKNLITQGQYQQKVWPLLAFVQKANSKNFRIQCLKNLEY